MTVLNFSVTVLEILGCSFSDFIQVIQSIEQVGSVHLCLMALNLVKKSRGLIDHDSMICWVLHLKNNYTLSE